VGGRIDDFPNNGFVLTRHEQCTGLAVIEFDGRQYLQYRGEADETLLTTIAYSVTVGPGYDKLALMKGIPSWFLRKTHIKLHATLSDEIVGLLTASHHGLVFSRS
jgi:hypothetical protein